MRYSKLTSICFNKNWTGTIITFKDDLSLQKWLDILNICVEHHVQKDSRGNYAISNFQQNWLISKLTNQTTLWVVN